MKKTESNGARNSAVAIATSTMPRATDRWLSFHVEVRVSFSRCSQPEQLENMYLNSNSDLSRYTSELIELRIYVWIQYFPFNNITPQCSNVLVDPEIFPARCKLHSSNLKNSDTLFRVDSIGTEPKAARSASTQTAQRSAMINEEAVGLHEL